MTAAAAAAAAAAASAASSSSSSPSSSATPAAVAAAALSASSTLGASSVSLSLELSAPLVRWRARPSSEDCVEASESSTERFEAEERAGDGLSDDEYDSEGDDSDAPAAMRRRI